MLAPTEVTPDGQLKVVILEQPLNALKVLVPITVAEGETEIASKEEQFKKALSPTLVIELEFVTVCNVHRVSILLQPF